MWARGVAVLCLCAGAVEAADDLTLGERARRLLIDLVRLDTSNPPGNETAVAGYLKGVAESYDIPAELAGADPARMNFIARLQGNGRQRPLLLMAHSDVVPADRSQWTVDPFAAELRGDAIYGRGAQDVKNLLAAELAVMVELKRRGVTLDRDIILVSEADEEAGSTGIQWLIEHAWEKIDAEAALNEGGVILDLRSGIRLFQVQTSEKIPTRVILTAHGTAGHASLPRADNAVVHLARAILRLESEQPVRMNSTTRRYFGALSKLSDYAWLAPWAARLDDPAHAAQAAGQIRARDPELDAQLRTTVSPTMLDAGLKINVIPNTARAQIDVRRLPNETREEVLERFRRLVNDPSVDVAPEPGPDMPATEPSTVDGPVYRALERVLASSEAGANVVPFMSRGATDGSYLRQKGMAVYGVPVFARENNESRAHGNDERISTANLEAGVQRLWSIVLSVAAAPDAAASQ